MVHTYEVFWIFNLFVLIAFALRLLKSSFSEVLDWWLVWLLNGLFAVWLFAISATHGAITCSIAILLLLVIPIRLDLRAQQLMRRGLFPKAIRMARYASIFHPFRAIAGRSREIQLYARLRSGTYIDDGTINATMNHPAQRLLWQCLRAVAQGDYSWVIESLPDGIRRAELLQRGFAPTWIRVLALKASLGVLLDTTKTIERIHREADEQQRLLIAAELFSAFGELHALDMIRLEIADVVGQHHWQRMRLQAFARLGYQKELGQGAHALLNHPEVDEATKRTVRLIELEQHRLHDELDTFNKYRSKIERLLAYYYREINADRVLIHLRGVNQPEQTNVIGLKPYMLTYGLSVTLVGFYLIVWSTGSVSSPDHLLRWGAFVAPSGWSSSSYRFVTYSFLHAGVLHLLMNVFAISIFGRFVEAVQGKWWMVLVYFLGVIAASATVNFFEPSHHRTMLVGASGGAFALATSVLLHLVLHGSLRKSQAGKSEIQRLTWLLVVQLLADQMIPATSALGHVAGAFSGVIASCSAYMIRRRANGSCQSE